MSIFQEKTVPPNTRLVGWAALVAKDHIQVPVRDPVVVANYHVKSGWQQAGSWRVFDKRYWPGDQFGGLLRFALQYETLDLLVLKRVFEATPFETVAEFVRSALTGVAQRRAWFLFEFLTGRVLDVEDSSEGTRYVDLLDSQAYFTASPIASRRHKVRDNLLGNRQFCPLVRRTKMLAEFEEQALGAKARELVGRTGAQVVARAASFLLLADSQASFAIEGERAPRNRLQRWGRAVLQAGTNRLTIAEILRLHSVLIEDRRFTQQGLRTDGVFLGTRDPDGDPLPEFIGARPQDLDSLTSGLIEANDRMRASGIDPVVQAAATAFGFVYIHPFADGNGRLQRCLIHDVLLERGFSPPGMVFPVSSVMLERIDRYRATLRAHTGPLLDYIEWRPTAQRNVEVLNDTSDFYRYFDGTAAAEFLYGCVLQAVQHDLPSEIDYLRRNDEAMRRVMELVEMPDRVAESLVRYVRLNDGQLGQNRRMGEFAALTDDEVAQVEAIVRDEFQGFVS